VTVRQWHLESRTLHVRGEEWPMRITRFPAGWLVSIDTVRGPTLGCDASPYLALARALEPTGVPFSPELLPVKLPVRA
jgi:hypothetical protein